VLGLVLVGQPQFQTGVEQIVVDVQMVDRDGWPIASLTGDDFEARIDQALRKVATVEFIRDTPRASPATGAPATGSQSVHEADSAPSEGRDFILAIDESSLHPRDAPAAARAARGFIERLSPADRVGLYLDLVSRRSFVL